MLLEATEAPPPPPRRKNNLMSEQRQVWLLQLVEACLFFALYKGHPLSQQDVLFLQLLKFHRTKRTKLRKILLVLLKDHVRHCPWTMAGLLTSQILLSRDQSCCSHGHFLSVSKHSRILFFFPARWFAYWIRICTRFTPGLPAMPRHPPRASRLMPRSPPERWGRRLVPVRGAESWQSIPGV